MLGPPLGPGQFRHRRHGEKQIGVNQAYVDQMVVGKKCEGKNCDQRQNNPGQTVRNKILLHEMPDHRSSSSMSATFCENTAWVEPAKKVVMGSKVLTNPFRNSITWVTLSARSSNMLVASTMVHLLSWFSSLSRLIKRRRPTISNTAVISSTTISFGSILSAATICTRRISPADIFPSRSERFTRKCFIYLASSSWL